MTGAGRRGNHGTTIQSQAALRRKENPIEGGFAAPMTPTLPPNGSEATQ